MLEITMHPFPPADEFQCLIGQVIERIGLNPYLTSFSIGDSELIMEHRLSHIEPDGVLWDYNCQSDGGPPLALHRLLMKRVVAIDRAEHTLTMTFEDGARLIAFSELGPYESGQFRTASGRYLIF